jgi:CBS domain-containing protein
MKVKEIMTGDAGFCYGVDSLTKAASIMWQRDCGAVPVVDAENKVIGMITDRDICIALASRDQKASEIEVGELCNGRVWTSSPGDDIKDAVKLMRKNQVRRLPVIDGEGRLQGVVAMADVITAAGARKKSKAIRKQIFSLVKALTTKTPIRLSEIAPENTENTANTVDAEDRIEDNGENN